MVQVLQTGFQNLLNPIFNPLLHFKPFWAILVLSLVLSFLITLVYKRFTNQQLLKQLKEDMKKNQTSMKEHKDNPEKLAQIQQETLRANMQLMKHSLRPTLITFLPIILIFGWVSAHYAFEPLMPNTPFAVTLNTQEGITGDLITLGSVNVTITNAYTPIKDNKAQISINAPEGDQLLTFTLNNQSYEKIIHVSSRQESYEQIKSINDKQVKNIQIDYNKLVIMELFGWKLGWIGAYIIWSILFGMGFRKLMDVY